MSERELIRCILAKHGWCDQIIRVEDLSGGCIHRVQRLTLADGAQVVVKLTRAPNRRLFEEEAASLHALAETRTVRVPEVFAVDSDERHAAIVMESLEPARATDDAWARFGESLAAMHQAPAGSRYGFEMDNHLGTTPQPNDWCDDWVTFNLQHRFGHQLRLARDGGGLSAGEAKRVQQLIDRLDVFLPRTPKPAILHGDLWSGNALPTRDAEGRTEIAVIDPATSVGDGWADIAMMKLFGGFAPAAFERYRAHVTDHDRVDQRLAVYQLYHVLNHVNLFGRGYTGQAMALLDTLGIER
ncbi:MAG: fructosamine kinase family protein [Phycisphaerales bacterium]|nr:MAG: fructosamine kinase family protein [Phycisphaerales bacterium]